MDSVSIIVTIASSIISGLVGGLFTFLGVLLTLNAQRKKSKKDETDLRNYRRPVLLIEKHYDSSTQSPITEPTLHILLVHRSYPLDECLDPLLSNPQALGHVDYQLKNIGETNIARICISSEWDYPIFNLNAKKPKEEYRNRGYRVSLESNQPVPRENSISLRYSYPLSPSKNIKNTLYLWLMDSNGYWWKQILYAPDNNLTYSDPSSYETYWSSLPEIYAKPFSTPQKTKKRN